MKKIVLSISASLLFSASLYAEDNATLSINNPTEKTFYGYNYIGFGVETATYQESGIKDGKNFKSSATSTSPVYTSGGLIKMNQYFDFSIDAASTLMPTQTDEKWQEDGYVKQENKFDTVQSDLKMLVQYKINNNHRVAIGPNYNLFSMKRHTYINPADSTPRLDKAGNPIGLNQEDIATLNMMAGYVYEHAPFSNGGMRIKAAAMYGKPVWNRATNTSSEEIEFSSTKGSTIDVDGYIGFELFKGLEAGFFGRYSLKKKDGADDVKVNASTVTWPENELETFRYGVSFVWNFDAK